MGLTFQVRNSITNWSQFATTGRPLLATHYRRHVERINTCRALYGVCYSQVSFGEYDQVVTVPLVDHAHRVPVTNANRNEFVRLYLDWILNKGIYEKFRAFYLGFHSVCASNALIVSFHNATLRIFNIRGNFLARWGVVRCVTRRNLMVDQSLDYNLHIQTIAWIPTEYFHLPVNLFCTDATTGRGGNTRLWLAKTGSARVTEKYRIRRLQGGRSNHQVRRY